MRRLPRTGIAVLFALLACAGLAGALSADAASEDGHVLAIGEPAEVPVAIEPSPGEGRVEIAWSAPRVGSSGNSTVPEDATRALLPVRPTRVGTDEMRLDVSQGNETVRLRVPVVSLPRVEARVSSLQAAPAERAHLYAGGSRAFAIHVTSRSPVPFTTNLTYRSGEATVALEPDETTVLEGTLPRDERGTRVGVLLSVPLGDGYARPLRPHRDEPIGRLELRVHQVPGIFPRIDAEFVNDTERGRLEGKLTLVPLGVQGAFDGVLRVAPAGPAPACANHVQPPLSAQLPAQQAVERSISIPWDCATDAVLRVRGTVEGRATPIEPATHRVDVPQPALNVTVPSQASTSTPLPTREGWRTLLWPSFNEESYRVPGPAVPADAFTDDDATPARAGEFAVWMVRDGAAVDVGEIRVDGFPVGVAAAAGPLALLLALIPVTRFP